MLNAIKLKEKINEKGMNVSELAKIMGIHRATLYRKISNNGCMVNLRDSDQIITALNLDINEANAIFFSQYLASNANIEKVR